MARFRWRQRGRKVDGVLVQICVGESASEDRGTSLPTRARTDSEGALMPFEQLNHDGSCSAEAFGGMQVNSESAREVCKPEGRFDDLGATLKADAIERGRSRRGWW